MDKPLIKKRKFAVVGITDQEAVDRIIESLNQKTGVIEVDMDGRKRFVRIKYDLMKINFEAIERSIKELGYRLSLRLKEKFKRGMAKFTEQNELDNITAPSSSCCSDPKEIAGNRRSCH